MTKEEKREYMKAYRQANKGKIAEQKKEYRQSNKDKIVKYYQANRERILEQMKEWRETNKEYFKEYLNTQMGRASNLLSAYNQSDKKHNRGQGDLTAQWIIDNIFSKPCKHCGKEGWEKIGCNRIDNDKPHTKDNVEPCCEECNKKLPRKKGR